MGQEYFYRRNKQKLSLKKIGEMDESRGHTQVINGQLLRKKANVTIKVLRI